jgi:hypothetical protein
MSLSQPTYPIDNRPIFLPYDPAMPVPPGYHIVSEPTSDFVAIGFGTAGAAYVLGLMPLLGAQSGNDDTRGFTSLLIPVLGPFVTIRTVDAEGLGIAALILLGAAQTGGLVMGFGGFAMTGKRLQRVSSAPSFVLAPGAPGAGMTGLSLRTSF